MMPQRARSIFCAALVVGVGADLLFRGSDMLRLGFALWVALLLLAALVVGAQNGQAESRTERYLLLAGMGCAAFGLVWRDSPLLYVIDFASLLCVGALTVWRGAGNALAQLTVVESVRAVMLGAINTVGGGVGVVREASGALGRTPELATKRRAIALGAVLALPPIWIVGALLSSSDRVFENLITRAIGDVGTLGLEHAFVALVFAWLAAGWLRAAVADAPLDVVPQVRVPRVSFLSLGVPLYALIALLLLFLATQAGMVFGGEEFLLRTAGLTAATYAREGFFQLVAAALVVLATLVALDLFLAADDEDGRRRFRSAGMILLVLVAILLGSAVTRLSLYVGEFGLTVDRFFAYALMAWVLCALTTFATTTLRGRAALFAPVTLVVTIVWVAALNVTNPEAIVVRVNVARAQSGRTFDAAYHADLSADALPMLARLAPRLDLAKCTLLADSLRSRWGVRLAAARTRGDDWRGTDLPVMRAANWYAAGATTPCVPSERPLAGTR